MTNEPTTGEIVRALRYCADVNSICGDACPAHIVASRCRTVLMQNAADRLESQEQTIDELEDECGKLKMTINLLTARAESAEDKNEWRYALMKLINENPDIKCASICDGDCMDCVTSASGTARGFKLKSNLRGLQPQDGGENDG